MSSAVENGQRKILWAREHMAVQQEIAERFRAERPLAGHRIGMSLHLEAKTAALALTLREGGATLYVIESNPLATQDDVAVALAENEGVAVNARRGVSPEEHQEHIDALLETRPTLIVEDGGEVVERIASQGIERFPELRGLSEETTTGVEQLLSLEREGRLPIPAIAVNSARMKHLIDNRYGTGQSTWNAILRATNLMVAGKQVLIVGYGWCGRGLALRAAGLGARVLVTDTDEIAAVEALMQGYEVVSLHEGMRRADYVITATGRPGVIGRAELEIAKDGVILANAGHFGFEIDAAALHALAKRDTIRRDGVRGFERSDGRTLYLLGEGELVNLSVGDGHPVEIMDISFALQALSQEYLSKNAATLPAKVHRVPDEIERHVARLVLSTWT
jgi:adenosylhomocysteinase